MYHKMVLLNGKYMTSPEEAHQYIKLKMELPDYYGHNLDALWDLLSTWHHPLWIELHQGELMLEHLGEGGSALLRVFQDAAKANPKVHFEMVRSHKTPRRYRIKRY